MTGLFYNLIGAWKFLSAGPRIRPKFTRPFFSFWRWGLHGLARLKILMPLRHILLIKVVHLIGKDRHMCRHYSHHIMQNQVTARRIENDKQA